jgi:hypothetical protein
VEDAVKSERWSLISAPNFGEATVAVLNISIPAKRMR